MKRIELAVVGIRLLAIYCYIVALQYLHGYVFNFVNWGEENARYVYLTTILSSLSPGIAMTLAATILLFLAPRIAKRMVGATADETISTPAETNGIQAMLFSTVGLLVCLLQIGPTFENVSNLIYRSNAIPFSPSDNPERAIREAWFILTGGILQLAIGGLVFFQARRLAAWWRHLRTWSKSHDPGART